MWLIDTQTLKLKFFLTPPPQYSILSHVWTDEECSFQEFRFPEHTQALIEKKGFKKIKACCELSLKQGFQWTWVDTCCIDKSSSAELSESINSMFSWYWSSTVCYAYLEDVNSTSTTQKVVQRSTDPEWRRVQGSTDPERHSESDSESNDPGSEPVFEHWPSRWYSRGWTLQELIAPLKVEFYNCYWTKIGTKWGLRREISSITGISEADLVYYNPRRSSIAQKMSWASARDTTRVEDKAYSLLGLFGVHLPLLYGEGRNAFRRLQEELIRTSTDHTIFAWRDRDRDTLLADSPAGFHRCGSAVGRVWTSESESQRRDTKKTYSITNGGLEMELWVLRDVNTVKHHLHRSGLSRRDLSKFIIGFFDYKDTVLPGLFMGLALMAEGAGRFRVYGQPIALTADVSEQLEIRTVVLAVDRPGGAMPLRRQIPVADTDIDASYNYRAQIFAAKELAWNSVRRVSCPGNFDTDPTAASFMKPKRDHTGSESITDVAVTPDGFYLFGITGCNPFDFLVLNLSAGPTCSISLHLLLSPALEYLKSTDPTECLPTWLVNGLACHVWETGTTAFGGNSALEGEYDGHISYWRELECRPGQDGVWIEHKLSDGRTLEVTVAGTGTGYDSPEILYIGLKDA